MDVNIDILETFLICKTSLYKKKKKKNSGI